MMNALGGPDKVVPSPGLHSSVHLWFPLTFIGSIAVIGPTPTMCISNLAIADGWTAAMRRLAKTPCLSVFKVTGIAPDARFLIRDQNENEGIREFERLELAAQELEAAIQEQHQVARPALVNSLSALRRCPKNENRLYQLLPVGWKSTGCSLGIARGNVQDRDIICRIPQNRHHASTEERRKRQRSASRERWALLVQHCRGGRRGRKCGLTLWRLETSSKANNRRALPFCLFAHYPLIFSQPRASGSKSTVQRQHNTPSPTLQFGRCSTRKLVEWLYLSYRTVNIFKLTNAERWWPC